MTANRPFRPRLLGTLLLLAILAAAAFVALPSAAEAQSRCGNYFYYYSDSTYTQLVGTRFYECNCWLFYWGVTTEYRIIEELDC
jgi:hypothetical protein